MGFPISRMRRTRSGEKIRAMVRETRLSAANLVMPLFVCEGEDVDRPISSMPGNSQLSIDRLVRECREISDLGIPAVILFGIPETKDEAGTGAWIDEGIVQRAVRAVKEAVPGLLVITDLCFCEYTSHGHCGVIRDGAVDNDATLENLTRAAVSQAAAGADMIAPSDMMDGRIGRIRGALDIAGYTDLPIMAYSAKYASAFYGPFREAAESAPQFGDRRSYQMDPANAREALREVELDIEEGADIVMVKPALPYLDIVRTVRDRFSVPVAAYNVSGEFSMVMAAAERGWVDADRVSMEILLCIKRAGADIILTYYAKKAARLLTAGPGA